ncbi:TetR/AcrR family transcriptional regulator [Haloglycomyces albus]|uniref:TetR/AcrR family transcriptional regulator n=1 Tax=Haloglycomyces albus TaxID=526067 RepID=UPI00046D6B77|nr:TetR/AcrR family transcriptional regulator [Haloglycomyces albus]
MCERSAIELQLLWRKPGPESRGRRKKYSLDDIVATAIDIADVEGLAALTIRRVASAMGMSTMNLYTYVPGTKELLHLMIDYLYLSYPQRPSETSGWRSKAEAVAEDNYDLWSQHAWIATAAPSRPPLGPGVLRKYEHELHAFDGVPLSDVEKDAALTYLLTFVHGAARAATEAAEVRKSSGVTNAEWWEANGPLLAESVTPEEYPLATRIGEAAGMVSGSAYDPDAAFRFGLERTLDGLAVLMDRYRS